jgi:hypothetical protein
MEAGAMAARLALVLWRRRFFPALAVLALLWLALTLAGI